MKIFSQVVTSASSGVWNYSNAIDLTRYTDNGFFNLEWNITGSGNSIAFNWSGSSSSTGTFTNSTDTVIKTAGTSISGPNGDGRDFKSFEPNLFPFIKIGAQAVGRDSAAGTVTTALACTLMVD